MMRSFYDVRAAIECEAAALCTERADAGTVNELDRLAGEFCRLALSPGSMTA